MDAAELRRRRACIFFWGATWILGVAASIGFLVCYVPAARLSAHISNSILAAISLFAGATYLLNVRSHWRWHVLVIMLPTALLWIFGHCVRL